MPAGAKHFAWATVSVLLVSGIDLAILTNLERFDWLGIPWC
jgi:hypothetical protein